MLKPYKVTMVKNLTCLFIIQKKELFMNLVVSLLHNKMECRKKHRHLQNVAWAFLFRVNLPKKFWGKAILTSLYFINRIPTPILLGKSPYEKLFGKKPSYTNLRTLVVCVFLLHMQKNHLSGKVFTSHDVIFMRTNFLFLITLAHHNF